MRLENTVSLDGYLDPALVLRAQRGDQGALAIVYECFFDRIYRYVLARIGSVPEAEDLTEEVFIRMLRSLGTFEPQTGNEAVGFSAWLFRIAHNLIVDRVRREASFREAQVFLVRGSAEDADEIEAELDRRWDQQELAAAVAQLTDSQRDVITLRFAAGLSVAETAAVLGKQPGNVKALQHNALVALRRLFEVESDSLPSRASATERSWAELAAANA